MKDLEQAEGTPETPEVNQEEIHAAILIQSAVRGWLAKTRLQKLRATAKFLQNLKRETQKKIPIKHVGPAATSLEAVLVLGGYDNDRLAEGRNDSRNIFHLDAVTNAWKVRGKLPQPRARHGTVQIGDYLYVFGEVNRNYMYLLNRGNKFESHYFQEERIGILKQIVGKTWQILPLGLSI